MVPFRYLIKKVDQRTVAQITPDEYTLQTTVWAIRVVSNRIPLGFTCLVQALSAKWLLRKHSGVRIHIGVHKSTAQEFSAHAWVTYNGTVILGEQTTQVFQPILEWK
ncbi:hypothetical protein GCM10028825_03510 [Spirosoma agri]